MNTSGAASAIIVLLLAATTPAWAADQRVSQNGRSFSTREITVRAGDTVQFVNDDEFIHQIYVEGTEFTFDSPESEPGNTIAVKFPASGDYEVHCHIHPKMALIVHVQ